MKCPFCGAFLENSLHKALGGVQTDPVISITNVDYVLELVPEIVRILRKISPINLDEDIVKDKGKGELHYI